MASRKSKARKAKCHEVPVEPPQHSAAGHGTSKGIMDLPKELLVEIIAYAIVSSKPITLRIPRRHRWATELANLREGSPLPQTRNVPLHRPSTKRTRKSPLLPILLLCKEFYFAGTEAFYGKNTFHFDDVEGFLNFKARIGERPRACIRQIVIDALWSVDNRLELSPSTSLSRTAPSSITQVDPLDGLPKLQSVTVSSSLTETCYFFVAASKARKAEAQIREKVLAAWESNSEAVKFAFPEDWGVVKDK